MNGSDPLEGARLPEGRLERRWGKGRQPTAEMRPEEVAKLVDQLEQAGIEVWVDGGWGVDALLREQRRSHDDLDLVVDIGKVKKLREVLKSQGYTFQHRDVPLSFEMVAPDGRQVDVHPVTFDEHGDGIYQMDNGKTWTYPAEGLAGIGHIAGRQVRCLTPELQMRVHAGYELSDKDHEEIRILQERFGVEPPDGYEPPSH
jgi:lincosamide nucleotidyltransferase A/C/D/E